jgi:hypothetical protein
MIGVNGLTCGSFDLIEAKRPHKGYSASLQLVDHADECGRGPPMMVDARFRTNSPLAVRETV